MSTLLEALQQPKNLIVAQKRELAELFGFETRNKYEIKDEAGNVVGFAAEQQKGFFGFLLRQLLGHWRTFEIFIFDNHKQLAFKANHPFRFFFQRLEVRDAEGRAIAALQQRFSIFGRYFDVIGPRGEVLLKMSSKWWRIWTYQFMRGDHEVARVEKKWSGFLSEVFTDKDIFRVQYNDLSMDPRMKAIVMVAAMFIDLQYFEAKAQSSFD